MAAGASDPSGCRPNITDPISQTPTIIPIGRHHCLDEAPGADEGQGLDGLGAQSDLRSSAADGSPAADKFVVRSGEWYGETLE